MIAYYLYEIDYGKKYKTGCVSENKRNIRLKSAEDLYQCLIGEPVFDEDEVYERYADKQSVDYSKLSYGELFTFIEKRDNLKGKKKNAK
jgi:hypothetical protein